MKALGCSATGVGKRKTGGTKLQYTQKGASLIGDVFIFYDD
jgi:hypothetical protein